MLQANGFRWLLALGAMMASGTASAQDGRAVVFGDPGFSGPSRAFTRANPDLMRPVTVRSVRIESGHWELCERTRFRKPCVTLTASDPALGRPAGWRGSMLSIRPVAEKAPPAKAKTEAPIPAPR